MQDKDGNSAMHLVALSGSEQAVRILADAGSSHAAHNKQGQYPLHLAAASDNESSVQPAFTQCYPLLCLYPFLSNAAC